MSDSVRPQRRQPTRLPSPWDSPGKNNGVGCHFLLQCMKVKSESEVAQSCPTLATPWTAAHQAPPSTGFSRQKYWSGCHRLLRPCITRDTQIETTRYYYKWIRMAKLKNTDNTESWKVSVEQLKFSFVAGGNVKMVQPLYKTIPNHTI